MSTQTLQPGFGNHFATEALPGALPQGRNSPQQCPYGLYAEQLSGTAFTVGRSGNRHSWLYRIRPAAADQRPFAPYSGAVGWTNQFNHGPVTPDPLRWDPLPAPNEPVDFIDGMHTWAGNGHCDEQAGCSINLYAATRSMQGRFFYNADAEMLVVPQAGRLSLITELGRLDIEPCEIAVIPRGVRLRVELPDNAASGYMLENFGLPFRLPELGPLGSNGLANPRDFLTPCAWYEDEEGDFELIAKFTGGFWRAPIPHSPLDVVAWHGTHAPCKYDLRHFNTVGSISYDHPDPCIFTVLTSHSHAPGIANVDFVVFPPRILVAEDTFRPPWFHRNAASEFMGLIQGRYDAKAEGFVPGGASLHNCMTPHGPDAATFEKAVRADTHKPDYIRDTMAFMFETGRVIRPTQAALESATRQSRYTECWHGLAKHFNPSQP